MMSPSLSLSKREYRYIGAQLARQNPELAMAILNEQPPVPEETDLTRITIFLDRFCTFIQVDRDAFVGKLCKPDSVDNRRLFIASMVHLYNPQAYNQSRDNYLLSYRFVTALEAILFVHNASIGRTIREVILRERVYPEFAEKVQQAIAAIKSTEVSNGSTQG